MPRKVRYRTPRSIQSVDTIGIVRDVLRDILYVVSEFISAQSGSYTTTGEVSHETVICTGAGAHTISLHASPDDMQKITVKRHGTGTVTVDTAGAETIDGASSLTLSTQYDVQTFMYSDDAGEYILLSAN